MYYKGMNDNILEWTKCLISPKYAKGTFLRIEVKKEQRILKLLNTLVIVLATLALAMSLFAAYRFGQYRQTKALIEQGYHNTIRATIHSD